MTNEDQSVNPSKTLFDLWKARFHQLDDTVLWPGPVPLSEDQSDFAVGREDDLQRLMLNVAQARIVQIDADSGVGKSSFLRAKAMDKLEKEGYAPIVVDSWSDISFDVQGSDLPDVNRMLAKKLGVTEEELNNARPVAGSDEGPDVSLSKVLGQRHHRKGILILDQFEELIRDSPGLLDAVISWINSVALGDDIRVVVSLRSEYVHRLKILGRSRPGAFQKRTLNPIVDERAIRQIVEGPSDEQRTSTSNGLIHPDAVNEIMGLWNSRTGNEPHDELPGLLQLQALLYALAHRGQKNKVVNVTPSVVTSFMEEADNAGQSVFAWAMTESVRLKLANCKWAGQVADLDRVLMAGAEAIIRRCASHLSSGGFKLVVRDSDLFTYALDRELRVHRTHGALDPFVAVASQVRSSLVSPGPSRDEEAVKGEEYDPTWIGNVFPWKCDPKEITSGPMMGMPPSTVMREEVRRFLFALEWLKLASLVRTITPRPDQTMVSLIHDGFSDPLERWARSSHTTPTEAIYLLTAARGETFDWIDDNGEPGAASSSHTSATTSPLEPSDRLFPRVIANVRWRDCRIAANFKNVTFVNCDFQGTRFEKCRFEGVVFLNCMLDGASIRDSIIAGTVTAPNNSFSAEPPSFQVSGLPPIFQVSGLHLSEQLGQLSEELCTYRGPVYSQSAELKPDSRLLFSETSGVPVLPTGGLTKEQKARSQEWRPETGGLTLYGGRVYSLMIERCAFEDGGTVALRGISGSSLDIVDPERATVVLDGSTIRGMSITVNDEDRRGPESRNVDLKATDSLLAGSWFGDELTGRLVFENCGLWQLWNNSALGAEGSVQGLHIEVSNCAYFGLVNAGNPDSESSVLGTDPTSIVFDVRPNDGSAEVIGVDSRRSRLAKADGSSMVDGANRMEYQAQPAAKEFSRRAAKSPK